MTRFTSSRSVEASFTWDRQWQHPSRRDHIYGRVKPLEEPVNWFPIAAVVFAVATFAAPLIAWSAQ